MCICVHVCGLYLCVCLYTCPCPSVPVYLCVYVSMYLCLCWGQLTSHTHPPGRAASWARYLLWLPEEGKGGLALCLSRRESPLSGVPAPPVPCSVPSNHHPDRVVALCGCLQGPWHRWILQLWEIPRASRLLLLKVWPEGFVSISWKQRISGPSLVQAPTNSESRIQQDLQVIHLNAKSEKHWPGLPLPSAGGRMVSGLIYVCRSQATAFLASADQPCGPG